MPDARDEPEPDTDAETEMRVYDPYNDSRSISTITKESRERMDSNDDTNLDVVMDEAHFFIDSSWTDAIELAERDSRKYD